MIHLNFFKLLSLFRLEVFWALILFRNVKGKSDLDYAGKSDAYLATGTRAEAAAPTTSSTPSPMATSSDLKTAGSMEGWVFRRCLRPRRPPWRHCIVNKVRVKNIPIKPISHVFSWFTDEPSEVQINHPHLPNDCWTLLNSDGYYSMVGI